MSIGSASLLENARLNALVVVPNAVQGIFRRRPTAVAVATRANLDGKAIGFLRGMNRKYDGGPVWVRIVRDPALLLLSPADVHRALEGSPDPFASDPKAKRDGMRAFQPDALTISRGAAWRNRRDFTDAVLDTGHRHRLSDRFAAIAAEEAAALFEDMGPDGEFRYAEWSLAFRRMTRRVILGEGARDDEELTDLLFELMAKANGMPGEPAERYDELVQRIGAYVERSAEGSLVSLFGKAPFDAETNARGQVIHWLFATGDTLAANALRCLALLATHPEQRAEALAEAGVEGDEDRPYLTACLSEAMRLWPTTPMLSRETTAETDWNGTAVPAGTQLLIVNTYLHRDTDRYEWADRFSPERWLTGEAAESFSFNHFSRGPQGCPGAGLALFLGTRFLAALLADRDITLKSRTLDPRKPLPQMLDYFALRFAVAPD